MLVKIEEIQEPGLDLDVPVERKVLEEALADSGGFTLVDATRLEVGFKKVSHRVHVEGSFGATVSAPCKRCTQPQQLTVPVEFHLRMVAAPRPASDEDEAELAGRPGAARRRSRKDEERLDHEGSFELDEVDVEPFDGKTIDLDPILREQLLLALPVSVLCRDDCRGLCTVCGQDLNLEDCGHAGQKDVDPRLARLKDIKLNN